jgi:DNA-binding transcriptional LysR family regulator
MGQVLAEPGPLTVGVAIVSEWMFAPELVRRTVCQRLPRWSLLTIDVWALYPSGRLASAKARAFAAFVEEIMMGEGAAPPVEAKA